MLQLNITNVVTVAAISLAALALFKFATKAAGLDIANGV